MKQLLLIPAMLLILIAGEAQSVKIKNKYGDPIVYIDGATLKVKNRYGDAIYYLDWLTIHRKNKY
jgi:formylmethanofuran dehydrogenase subunit D